MATENFCGKCKTVFRDRCELQDHLCRADKFDTLNEVANQEHYTQFKVQPMEYCQVNGLGWCASNVVKYVSRENKKDGLKDLYKAMDYLRCLIHYKKTGTFLTPDKMGNQLV